MSRDMTMSGPTKETPRWAGDFMSRDHLVPAPAKLKASAFSTVSVVVGAAGALAAATSVPVDPLPHAIPNGTVLHFGTNKYAKLNAAAAKGATSLTTLAIPTALVDNDTATYTRTSAHVPSGTVVARTIAERDSGEGFRPMIDTDPTSEMYLTAFDVDDASDTGDVELYRPGGTVYETYLPDWANLSSTVKAALRARYHVILAHE